MKRNGIFVVMLVVVTATSCKKEDPQPEETTVSQTEIINEMALNVNSGTYSDLANQSESLFNALTAFVANPDAAGLTNCRQLWKDARSAWEQSEGFLYGPVATANIDPRIDSWPVDFNAINSLLAGSTDFSNQANIDALDDALKGFHPIEFILWGENGTKVFSDFTTREKEYLVALGNNLKSLTATLSNEWTATNSAAYIGSFTSPGASNAYYATYQDVYQELVDAMIGICEEVAEGKMGEPFTLQDPSLEESPYSSNSMTDFTNNIISVENVYLGKYANDGLGIEDLVREHNLSLDNTIKSKIQVAKSALASITLPFGEAIISQPTQVQNAIAAIEDLKNTLETELHPFVQQYVTN